MQDLKIHVDLEKLTIGDLEKLEARTVAGILEVLDHVVMVEGHDVRKLHYTALQQIAEAIRQAVEAETNPVVDGKN